MATVRHAQRSALFWLTCVIASVIATCGGFAAWEVSVVITGPLQFTDPLMESYAAVPEPPDVPSTFRDSIGLGRRAVSRIEPALPAAVLQQLKRTSCLWVSESDNLRLNWEMIMPVTPVQPWFQEDPFPLGACTLTHARSRIPLRGPDGHEPDEIRLDVHMPRHQLLRERFGSGQFDECRLDVPAGTEIVIDATGSQQLCVGAAQANRYPLCADACELDVPATFADLDSRLSASFLGDTTQLAELREDVLIKTVSGSRTLSRPLSRVQPADMDGCRIRPAPDHTCCNERDDRCYRWLVNEVTPSGPWEENFTPSLVNSQIRFFVPVETPEGLEKHYIVPTGLYLSFFDTSGMQVNDCAIPAGATNLNTDNCPPIGQASPVQFNHLLGRRIGWEVVFDDDKLPIVIQRPGRPNDPFVIGDAAGTPAPIRIEFTVVPINVQALLAAQPPEVRFTYNLHDPASAFPAKLEAVNLGTTSVDVQAVAQGGPDGLLIQFTPTQPLPTTLNSGVPLPLEVRLVQPITAPRSISATGDLAYQATGATGGSTLLSVPIEIYADDPGLQLVPAMLRFQGVRECGQLDVNARNTAYRRNALLANNSAEAMEIQTLTVEGANAAAFRLEEQGDPRVVPSGGAFLFTMHYEPTAGVSHSADVRVQHQLTATQQALADRVLPLTGETTDHCAAPLLTATPNVQFGVVETGLTRNMGFRLGNDGDAALNVSALSVSGAQAAAFSHGFTSVTIPPGGRSNVALTFSPLSAGSHAATIGFTSNDPNAATVSVALAGYGAGREFAWDAAQLTVPATSAVAVQLLNTGPVAVVLPQSAFSVSGPFEIIDPATGAAPGARTLAVGDSYGLQIRFTPSAPPGRATGSVTATSTGSPPASATIQLSGTR